MTEWLTQTLGETGSLAILVVGALILVLGLLIGLMKIGQRLSDSGIGRKHRPRLRIIEAAALDTKRKLVLVRRDEREHLVLIGGPNDLLIEANIEAKSRDHTPSMSTETTQVEPLVLSDSLENGESPLNPASDAPLITPPTRTTKPKADAGSPLKF